MRVRWVLSSPAPDGGSPQREGPPHSRPFALRVPDKPIGFRGYYSADAWIRSDAIWFDIARETNDETVGQGVCSRNYHGPNRYWEGSNDGSQLSKIESPRPAAHLKQASRGERGFPPALGGSHERDRPPQRPPFALRVPDKPSG